MKQVVVAVLVVWQLALSIFLTLAGRGDRTVRALSGMLWGLDLLWIGGAGLISVFCRDRIRALLAGTTRRPGLTFVLFATLMALIEEAVTTLMTNCAPLFGAEVGEVYITASANYLDVVLLHSVVVLVPQFALWAWLLSRWAFSPFAVFLVFGLTGLLDEAIFAGPQPLAVAQWILVYGLMVYLPAYCYPNLSGRAVPRWWHYPLAVVLPILGAVPVVALVLLVIAPGHPSIHFPPIGGR